jgi:AcrR family transcriptional regulator
MSLAMTLRDRQKVRRRESMLDAARQLFIETGYNKTTLDAIAEHAEVGVATVYTYFGSKEGVFAALARRDMSELKAEGARLLENLPEDPVAAVVELLTIYDKVHNFVSHDVIRDFNIGAKIGGPLREAARWLDDWKVTQIKQALDQAQREERLAPGLPTQDAAEIINDLFNRYYEREGSLKSAEKAFSKLKGWITLLFDNWRT